MSLIKSISGIRGTIGGKSGEALTPIDIVKFSSAFAQWVIDKTNNRKIVIGRDARISGSMVNQLITSSLQAMGIHVIDLGLSTTPTVELAVTDENAGGGIIVTASHNPKEWNAMKLLNREGEFLAAKDGENVLAIAEKAKFEFADVMNLGLYETRENYIHKHIEKILALPLVKTDAIKKKKFKVVVDAVNSSGGIAVPLLLKALGVQTIFEMYCEPNGKFPHNPEPLEENLSDIKGEVKLQKADVGIVVDPDVDRLAIICEDGTMFGEEYTLVSVADYILQHKKGNTVSNLSSTRALKDVTEKAGGKYYGSAVGEVNVVAQMKECKAVIGGEGNGGVIYPDLHYGRDALVGIALFLSHLATCGKTCSVLRSNYPNYFMSKKKINAPADKKEVLDIMKAIEEKYKKQPINKTDGLKIEFDDSWIHLRTSNTEPIIRIYTESKSQNMADSLAFKIMDDIKQVMR